METNWKQQITNLAKTADHRTLATWAANCAEHVLPYFEDRHPNEKRPRLAIEASRAWIRGEITVGHARDAAFAAHAAARDVIADRISCHIARATGHAAATAHVPTHAIHAANYAAKAIPTEPFWQYEELKRLLAD
ncbi:hypothetical protein BMT55_03700 [Listeria newyorkensis]|uniref:Imm-5-like domain-containing protein n=1 Tax=Listeria newyorkensis TaxID=1497681 RepID=A0ABX4XQ76_9LIST|nr:hypothetical protein [Listeria newyorkensis]PNP93883.1 hypothetical protein BMT55_03700 [Listeria newyorkensis]WAO22507.1 hypothetical protein OTR81_04330 [Listeria newyorkensis]SQC51062.1 Uncharacterised protein [Listeria newyorkensis]